MAINAQKIKLNMVPGGIIPIVHLSQNDIGRVLQFELYDGVSAASITTGTTVTVEGTKPDRHAFQYDATISGNVVTVNTVQQMVIVPGTVECTLSLTYNSQVIGTALFFMEVERSGLDVNADVSDTELPALMDLARANAERSEVAATAAASSATAAESSKNGAGTFATLAQNMATLAESWAVGDTNTRTGEATNNSKYWCQQSMAALQEVSAMASVMRLLIGTVYFTTESGDTLITEDGDNLIMDY